jgi:Trk-type K+ transport system membrane component
MMDNESLDKLNTIVLTEPLYNYTFFDIILGIKYSCFGILDDLLNEQFTLQTFLKDNRLFFIGLILFIICSLLYLFNYLTTNINIDTDNDQFINDNTIKQ